MARSGSTSSSISTFHLKGLMIMNESELSSARAITLSQKLSNGDISPLELMDATISRIEAVNPLINALPILCPIKLGSRRGR